MARVATTRGRNFWTLEMVVPLSALSDRPVRKGDVWRFNIGRTRALPRPYESVCWAPTLSGFHERNKFGSLVMG
jgi:hypothetical protein